jgi:hypothetical protein
LPHPQLCNPKSFRTRNRAQLAFLMVATRKRNRNFRKFILYLIKKLVISALIFILSSIELLKNEFFGSKIALIAKNLQFLSYKIVIYTKREGIFVFISCMIA